ITLVLILSALLISYRPIITSDGRCLFDFDTFAYRYRWFNDVDILPLYPWENRQFSRASSIEFSRVIDNQQELWFRTHPDFPPIEGRVFNRDTKTWHTLDLSDHTERFFDSVVNFTADKSGQVWGVASRQITINGRTRHKAVLVRYDEEQDRFIVIAEPEDGDFENSSRYSISNAKILTDSLERVWMIFSIASSHLFYVYDPKSQEFKKLPEHNGFSYPRVTISDTGEVYISTVLFDNALLYQNPSQPAFARYSAETEQWVDVDLPEGFQPVEGNIGFDARGRLHIGTSAWRGIDNRWHITDNVAMFDEDTYPNIELKFVSSDGRLWFTRRQIDMSGTGWYNPDTLEGCMFTTFTPLSIIEDHNQYLWMVVDGSIYRLNLNAPW
nr:hypothetical protein [Anaerolineae bacterium]